MKIPTQKTILAPLVAATLLLGMSSTYAATYDWSNATASAGAGTTLNTASGSISGANDGWHGSTSIPNVFAVNDSQPVGVSGNYAKIGGGNANGDRDNDLNFGYSISSAATEVTLSAVLNVSNLSSLAWIGLSDSTGGEDFFRIGFYNGNWVYRDNDNTIVSMADTGVSAVGGTAKSYLATAVFDLVGDTYDYTVENLTDGGSIVLANGVAVDSSVAALDWSVYDGLRIRGDDVSYGTFTVSSIPEPSAFALLAGLGALGLLARRRR